MLKEKVSDSFAVDPAHRTALKKYKKINTVMSLCQILTVAAACSLGVVLALQVYPAYGFFVAAVVYMFSACITGGGLLMAIEKIFFNRELEDISLAAEERLILWLHAQGLRVKDIESLTFIDYAWRGWSYGRYGHFDLQLVDFEGKPAGVLYGRPDHNIKYVPIG